MGIRRSWAGLAGLAVVVALAAGAGGTEGRVVPFGLQRVGAGVFPDATSLAFAPGDASRAFATLKDGRIVFLRGGTVTEFQDLGRRVGSSGSEQGLLGLAFHPGFAANGRYVVSYTDRSGTIQIEEYRADGDRAAAGSRRPLLSIPHPGQTNHNGGQLVFGPDGLLYVGVGDGGGQGDPNGNAQDPDVLLGKLLRIDVDHGSPYAIPPANPFAGGGGRPEIYAIGARNPWKLTFDAKTRALYVADVGGSLWEEVDRLEPGASGLLNLGWNAWEGPELVRPQPTPGTLIQPVHWYGHDDGCSIVGGYAYRGGALRALRGQYLYADYCGGYVQAIEKGRGGWKVRHRAELGCLPTSFGEEPGTRELLVVCQSGDLFRVVP